ncbi:coiled-coil domain-containing protein [Paratractidigestivibacter sp.]|uniref:coiled-coil domain-containing protein n=1 Tax=Paratractidigestivibacter sp. TaxID=2847316 RepID=UPI002ABE2D91|nr:NlpC/P60 family protein [Paratractidigestivibacter sp.]
MQGKHITLSSRVALAAVLAGTLTVLPLAVPVTAQAATIEELQSQLNSAMAHLDELEDDVAEAERALDETNNALDETISQISELQAQISDTEADLAVAKQELSEHISTSYKSGGGATLLELVLSSQNFEDLVSRVYYANRVSAAKQQSIETVTNLENELNSEKSSLEKQQQEQQQLLESQTAEAQAANEAVAQQSSYVNGLSTELQAAVKAEQERIEAEKRAAAEAAQKKADEEAARAAAQKTQEEAAASSNMNSSSSGSSSSSASTYTGDSSSARSAAVAAALAQVGKGYSWSDSPSAGFSCNGLCWYAWGQAGVTIPHASGHYAYGQFQWMKASGRWVSSVSQMQPGDLVFYSYDGGASTFHVAMYIGNGQVVQSSDSTGVSVESVNWCSGFCGGGSPI